MLRALRPADPLVRFRRSWLPRAALLAALLVGQPPAAARAGAMTVEELRAIAEGSTDPESAAATERRIRSALAGEDAGPYRTALRQYLVQALVTRGAPGEALAAAGDSALALLAQAPPSRGMFAYSMASVLLERGEMLPVAERWLRRSLADLPEGAGPVHALARGALGGIQAESGDPDSAIANLSAAIAALPATDPGRSPRLMAALGRALERKGRTDEAIDSYVQSLAVFGASDTSAMARLRALYARRHGGLAGLDARVSEARAATRRAAVFDSRKDGRPAPPWALKGLDGKVVESSSLKGKVIVLDFWGSWCGPCRLELPHFQRLYDKYKGRGVAFFGINWENPGPPERRLKAARDYVAAHKFTFPVLLDHDAVAVRAYGVNSFPTVFVIDKGGRIQFRNPGYFGGISEVIEEQIREVMQPGPPASP